MGSALGLDADALLRRLMEDERPRLETELQEILADVRAIDAWLLGGELSAEKRGILERVRRDRADALASRLVSWRQRGGGFELVVAPGTDRPSGPVPEDAPPAEVATIVSVPGDPGNAPRSSAPAASVAVGHELVRSRPPTAPPATDWRGPLLSFLASLRPDRLPDEELEELDQLVRGKERLRGFPHHVQVSLLEYAAARLRYLQHRGVADARIQPFMAEIRSHADREGCGFVHGPKRTSGPTSSSWDSDARTHLNRLYDRTLTDDAGRVNFGRAIAAVEELVRDAAPFEEVRPLIASAIRVGVPASNTRLVNLVAPFHGNMTDAPELRTLRGAIRTAERAARAPPEPEAPAIPADWPWLAFTRGKRVVMIGGDPREPNRVRIEKAFAFGELVWEPTEFKPRSSDAVRDRISSGGVDFLIILRRFVGHDVDEKLIPVCETTGTPYVSVPNGYGIGRIRQEIEHRIPRPEPA